MRVKLTDQALVAVTLAREHAAACGRRAHVADLLAGLATEPDGVAGRVLSEHSSAVTALAGRLATASPRLPAAEVALRWAHDEVGDRPAGTVDLLLAACEVGGGELADLLERCGLPATTLAAVERPAVAPLPAAPVGDALTETYGLDPRGGGGTLPAARAVARARAVAGGALTLVAALAVEAGIAPHAVPLDPDEIAQRLASLPAGGGGEGLRAAGDPDWDAGLDTVLDAASRIRDDARPLDARDLLRAAALVGGAGPRRLLAPGASGATRP